MSPARDGLAVDVLYNACHHAYRNFTPPLRPSRIARVWWPLAASWLLMAAELPTIDAVVARLPDPVIN